MIEKTQERGSILIHVKFIQKTPRNTMCKDPDHYINSIFESVFLMASVPSGSEMYRTCAVVEIHAAVHFIQKAECMKYTLHTSFTLCF